MVWRTTKDPSWWDASACCHRCFLPAVQLSRTGKWLRCRGTCLLQCRPRSVVQEAGLEATTRNPRESLVFHSGLFWEAQDHCVLSVYSGHAALPPPTMSRWSTAPPLRKAFCSFENAFRKALQGAVEFILALAVRFKSIDGPLHLDERKAPPDRGGKQPEELADLRVAAQVDALSHTPGQFAGRAHRAGCSRTQQCVLLSGEAYHQPRLASCRERSCNGRPHALPTQWPNRKSRPP
ncbi:MAG: hypothetical protein KatS3mg111_2029 [Pirellulaceae bacterium]|nr:MAG: hypothetical protein KatS3mg111_2029 [Pirellulaceae bacterium]